MGGQTRRRDWSPAPRAPHKVDPRENDRDAYFAAEAYDGVTNPVRFCHLADTRRKASAFGGAGYALLALSGSSSASGGCRRLGGVAPDGVLAESV